MAQGIVARGAVQHWVEDDVFKNPVNHEDVNDWIYLDGGAAGVIFYDSGFPSTPDGSQDRYFRITEDPRSFTITDSRVFKV